MARLPHVLRAPGHVADVIRELHPQIKRKLRAALTEIVADPSVGTALRHELAGLCSFRLGKFRIIYRVNDRVEADRRIELVAFGPRTRIYEETYRLVAQGR